MIHSVDVEKRLLLLKVFEVLGLIGQVKTFTEVTGEVNFKDKRELANSPKISARAYTPTRVFTMAAVSSGGCKQLILGLSAFSWNVLDSCVFYYCSPFYSFIF